MNHLLDTSVKFPYAKRIEGLVQVFQSVSDNVKELLDLQKFPLIIASDHGSAGGTIAGIKAAHPNKRLGVVWVDAHADLHTPYTTPSGNMHGMPLAIAMAEDNLPSKVNEVKGETLEFWEKCKNIGIEGAKLNPEDLNLLLTEADFYIKLNKMDEFGKLMKEAVVKDPNNPTLFFNLGVVTFGQGQVEEAKGYYKKAIELDPKYSDAYLNLAIAILSKEKAIVEEMNNSLSNLKKYDALEKKQKDLYREALPYLEKGDAIKRDIESVKALLNIYDILEMLQPYQRWL